MSSPGRQAAFEGAQRPDVALISNHGYAGADLPAGGAQDTGGQNLYVNSLALALDRLGYRVTIFTRGGFPFFGRRQLRLEPEYLSEHVRYVFVPGGGERFLAKEEISVALDEQLDWLDGFIRAEAAARGVPPWQVYQFVNSHYWDAGVLGLRLVERWRNDVAARALRRLLDGVLEPVVLDTVETERHARALGDAPTYHLGALLLGCDCSPATPVELRIQVCATRWVAARGLGHHCVKMIGEMVAKALDRVRYSMAPALQQVVAADALGVALLTLTPDLAQGLKADLDRVDRHVWTPHSLAEHKDELERLGTPEERRALRFCERRDHERMICERVPAFAVTSAGIAARLRTHYRVPVEQIFYFPPCVDSQSFRKYRPEETVAAYDYLAGLTGLPVERLRKCKLVLETSRMDATKRKDLLLSAFAQVAPVVADAVLLIGGGPRNEVFAALQQQLAATPDLAGRAFLAGFIPVEHLGPLFSMAAVYCSASELEGFGTSVSQAAASHTAVIASDRVPFCLQYAPGEAVMVHAGDVEDYASALRRLLEDDDERDWRAAGLAEKVRVLDWQRQAGQFVDHLRRAGMEIARP